MIVNHVARIFFLAFFFVVLKIKCNFSPCEKLLSLENTKINAISFGILLTNS